MFCPNCGKRMPDGAKFCIGCGQKLIASMISTKNAKSSDSKSTPQQVSLNDYYPKRSESNPASKKNNTYAIFFVTAILIVMIVIVIAIFAGGRNYTIVGKWKNNGSVGYGQAQPGAIVVFDESKCNFFSPMDTYTFYKENGAYQLSFTGLLGGSTTFDVVFEGKNRVKIHTGSGTIMLDRVE